MTDTVLYEKKGQIVTITMNRPDALNSLNRELRKGISDAIVRYDEDADARVAIITGAGRAFCAGRDLKERAADNAAGVQARGADSTGFDTVSMWPKTWKPLIAAINGHALAGGWSIAQHCDMRIAAEDAKLGITEAKWSLLPPFAGVLTRMMPMAHVFEIVWTAEQFTAQRCYEMGFVNKVVPREKLMDEAYALAAKITEMAPLSIQYFKEIVYRGQYMAEPALASFIRHVYDRLLVTEDAKEGPRAFAEKRKPRWKGR